MRIFIMAVAVPAMSLPLLIGGCSDRASPLDTTVGIPLSPDDQTEADAAIGMDQYDLGNHCWKIKLIQRDVLERDAAGKPSVERWLVDACSHLARYRVTYSKMPTAAQPDGIPTTHYSREE